MAQAQQSMVKTKEEPSIGDLFSDLAAETGTLVRQEVALAKVELTKNAATAGKNVGYLMVGGAIGYAALLLVLTSAVIILANFIPLWTSALILGLVVGSGSFFIISSALTELKKADLTPRETVESIKEDAQWLKNQVS